MLPPTRTGSVGGDDGAGGGGAVVGRGDGAGRGACGSTTRQPMTVVSPTRAPGGERGGDAAAAGEAATGGEAVAAVEAVTGGEEDSRGAGGAGTRRPAAVALPTRAPGEVLDAEAAAGRRDGARASRWCRGCMDVVRGRVFAPAAIDRVACEPSAVSVGADGDSRAVRHTAPAIAAAIGNACLGNRLPRTACL